jgi:hypothetical protein
MLGRWCAGGSILRYPAWGKTHYAGVVRQPTNAARWHRQARARVDAHALVPHRRLVAPFALLDPGLAEVTAPTHGLDRPAQHALAVVRASRHDVIASTAKSPADAIGAEPQMLPAARAPFRAVIEAPRADSVARGAQPICRVVRLALHRCLDRKCRTLAPFACCCRPYSRSDAHLLPETCGFRTFQSLIFKGR